MPTESRQVTEDSCETACVDQELPDLIERLLAVGLHEEYLQYKAAYMAWRQGSAQGSVGELQDLTPSTREAGMSPQKFELFFTISYWVAISFTMGALVLTFTSIAPSVSPAGSGQESILSWIVVFGNFLFTVSAYLSYFQLVNSTDAESSVYIFLDWQSMRQRGVALESLVGVLAFLIGMLIYDIAVVLELFLASRKRLIQTLLLLGGIGFFIGGLCEVLHNWKHSPLLAWWASISNCIAGVLLVFGSIADFFEQGATAGRIFGAVGLGIYVVTGVLLIKMWQVNDFGLTLQHHINTAVREGGHLIFRRTISGSVEVHHTPWKGAAATKTIKKRRNSSMSTRGVAFLVIYCWLFACCAMNCVASFVSHVGPQFLDAMNYLFCLMVVSIVLLVHSAITRVPNQQPYRSAMICMRVTLFLAALWQTHGVSQWLQRSPVGSTFFMLWRV
eukprot:TRINITY_DN49220_c0_g1_i1.p1 TRINITY_DN49220_c0_g1~~TRINITY_DN49220_c0_g1_i1.p1  ORF type:complete len:446 (+),score=75.03 TRINITY_DN49220_c0_g1_i1:121-1458(+)